MPALPRLRQLRRDKILFTLAINTIRLHLAEADQLAAPASPSEETDSDLQLIQQSADQWVSLSMNYLTRKYHCTVKQALELLGELQAQMKRNIPADELRQVPLHSVLGQLVELPAEPASEQPAP